MAKYLVVRYHDEWSETTEDMRAVSPDFVEPHNALLCDLSAEDVANLRLVSGNGQNIKALEILEPETVAQLLEQSLAEQAVKRHKAAIAAEARAKKREERKAREAAQAAELERRLLDELKAKYPERA